MDKCGNVYVAPVHRDYVFRACDIADLLCKGRNSVTRWLNRGLCDERDDPVFSEQINHLDAEISRR